MRPIIRNNAEFYLERDMRVADRMLVEADPDFARSLGLDVDRIVEEISWGWWPRVREKRGRVGDLAAGVFLLLMFPVGPIVSLVVLLFL